jgi:hypothetical protein
MDLDRADDDLVDDEEFIDEGGYYSLVMKLEFSIIRNREPEEFVDEYEGDILYYADCVDPRVAGKFQCYRVRVDDAKEAGEIPSEVFDAHSFGLVEYYDDLYASAHGDFNGEVERKFEIFGGNLLILDMIEILPEHRGKGLGLAAAWKMLEVLGPGCELAVCRPLPIRYSEDIREESEFAAGMKSEGFGKNEKIATSKLRAYWSRLGFERIGRTSTFARSPHKSLPDLKTLCDADIL